MSFFIEVRHSDGRNLPKDHLNLLIATYVRDPHLGHELQCNFSGGKMFGMNSLLPNWIKESC